MDQLLIIIYHFDIIGIMELFEANKGFSALADATRLDSLRRLIAAGPRGLSAGALCEAADTPASTMSFHLKELSAAGLVQSRRNGRSIIYSANYGALRSLIDFLLGDCCQGDPRLCGPYVVKAG